MILGGLIVFSVIWCLARCLCCGLSCCCSCFSCLKCCGNCCGCCDSPDKKHKHLDEPYFPPAFGPKQGYQAPGVMMSGGDGSGHGGWTPGAAPVTPFDDGRPKFATYETGPNGMAVEPKKVVNDDALPPMPSWEQAQKRQVSIEEEPNAVALQNLNPATGAAVPLMSGGAISRTGTPVSTPYGQQNPQFGGSQAAIGGAAMMAGAGGRPQDPYRQNSNNSRGPGGYNNDPYSQNRGTSGPGGFGRGGYLPAEQSPYNPSFPADVYGGAAQPHTCDNFSRNLNQGYGQDRGPSPQHFEQQQPQRNLSVGANRPYAMDRGFSNASTNQQAMSPSGPLENGGFEQRGFGGDAGGAYARAESPPPMDDSYGAGFAQSQRSYMGSTAPPSYVSRAPANQGYGSGNRY